VTIVEILRGEVISGGRDEVTSGGTDEVTSGGTGAAIIPK
jgi:hypothetical protein